VPYAATRAIALRRTDFSETSQVVALVTPDMGQIHALAKGARRASRSSPKTPWQLLEHYDCVLSLRAKGKLHLLTEWKLVETFRVLHRDLACQWTASMAAEIVLSATAENPDDGAAYGCLLGLLRRLEHGQEVHMSGFLFLNRMLAIMGAAPETTRCVHCGRTPSDAARFSAAQGGTLCGACSACDPAAFPISRGALTVFSRLAHRSGPPPALRLTASQRAELERAFREQIQYHLGRELRCARFVSVFMD
jgi:DNA repair protein RecO (recombination protein O)